LSALDNAPSGLSINGLQAQLNLRHSDIEKALKFLSVESPSPVAKLNSAYHATPTATNYRINEDYVRAIGNIRRQEQAQMAKYMNHDGCYMEFLQKALDDKNAKPCGKCANCLAAPLLSNEYDHDLANRAAIFLRRSYQPLPPRKIWPPGNAFPFYEFNGRIGDDLRAEEGRALCLWRDAGWGQLVAFGKYKDNCFSVELVKACAEMFRSWNPQPAPLWITCIPSINRPTLIPNFSQKLASEIGLPFKACLVKCRNNAPQKTMQNSFQQAANLDGVFEIQENLFLDQPCLLIDDMVDSRWTFTVATAILKKAGCHAVFPLALALNSPRMD
jgi:ATP-dependent DNA helicase RecQ